MALPLLLEALNYGLVLLYGILLSADITGGWQEKRSLVLAFCPLLLALQTVVAGLLGVEAMRRLYPLLIHLPLVLLLIFGLKRPAGMALTGVCTAYLLCQLPRWVKLLTVMATGLPFVGEAVYTLSIVPLFFLLRRFFAPAAHSAMTASRRSLWLFGSLPLAYYVFDYAAAVYSDLLYDRGLALVEFLPTALIFFYVLFMTAYHNQLQKGMEHELQRSMLENALKQSALELDNLRRLESRMAIHQHDMRHHLAILESHLRTGDHPQVEAYIREVRANVDALTPAHFCENEPVNLLCIAFSERAKAAKIDLRVKAGLPKRLPISDTELCSVLSNALENAIRAAAPLEELRRWVTFSCEVKRNNLLIEIRNPFDGTVRMENGIPQSGREGHGYGCRSMRNIVQQHHGHCLFDTENGVFTVRIVLPMLGLE